jgi:hypothetical protein
MGRYTRGWEFHRYICGIGQESGKSSAVISYWFCAFGWMSALPDALTPVEAGCREDWAAMNHYTPSARTITSCQMAVTASRSATNSCAEVAAASPAKDR